MDDKIIDSPLRITLFGFRGEINGQMIPVVGKLLMDAMWHEVRDCGIQTKGLNHWVYLPDSAMFVGVEMAEEQPNRSTRLAQLDVSLERYLQYVHKGPYSTLPHIWPPLMAGLEQQGETVRGPHLEIYGHGGSDPAKCETTILIGLKQ